MLRLREQVNSLFNYPAAVVEADPAVVFCLDSALTITYCNAAWDQFAVQNQAPELCRPGPIGKCVLDYISGPARDFYARVYERVLVTSKPLKIDTSVRPQKCTG